MSRLLVTVAVLGATTLTCAAVQAQTVPSAHNPKGTASPWTATAEQAFVTEEIRGAGYSGVNSLMRDSDGTWHARAYKGDADVQLAVDHAGHISQTR